MRYTALIPSSADPKAWADLRNVELVWTGELHSDWAAWVRRGSAVHALHLPLAAWNERRVSDVAETLRAALGADFIVIPTEAPKNREEGFRFLSGLEALLEATRGRGVKLAIQPVNGAELELVTLLRQARGEAVGFCWTDQVRDLEVISDRLFCAVGDEGTDLSALQRLGYRWNLALKVESAEAFHRVAKTLDQRFPSVLFPAEMPTTALGRPVVADDSLSFGAHWKREGEA
jgi:hypothetical protein